MLISQNWIIEINIFIINQKIYSSYYTHLQHENQFDCNRYYDSWISLKIDIYSFDSTLNFDNDHVNIFYDLSDISVSIVL